MVCTLVLSPKMKANENKFITEEGQPTCARAALSYFLLHQEANEVKPDTYVHFNLSCWEQICIDLHLSIDLI